ncbi:MAG: hypothetical protein AAFW82_10710 [Pseudomonadota bacterium]
MNLELFAAEETLQKAFADGEIADLGEQSLRLKQSEKSYLQIWVIRRS